MGAGILTSTVVPHRFEISTAVVSAETLHNQTGPLLTLATSSATTTLVASSSLHTPAAVAPLAQTSSIRSVPFYSQFTDISSPAWKKVGCGIASLAMLINYYEPNEVTVNGLLKEGIAAGAYISDAGWSHAGLISLAQKHGLTGASRSLADLSMNQAFSALETAVAEGPVMVSVHYTFVPTNPIPHLVVVTGIKNDRVYFNDPAGTAGGGSISAAQFKSAWKKRYIAIRS